MDRYYQLSPKGAQTVNLGCGTLILIILIVVFFGRGSDNRDLEAKIENLRVEIRTLNNAIESQKLEIQRLSDKLAAKMETRKENP